MAIRSIVHIDEDKCNGCGLCIPSCAEGAIKIIDGKARLVADKYCDGLGACLGTCPQDAITIIEREADEFDEEAVKDYLESISEDFEEEVCSCPGSSKVFSCPGSRSVDLRKTKKTSSVHEAGDISISIKSRLKQWPVQLMLVPVEAPYFENADLLITADCAAVAYPNYHLGMLKGKAVVMGCPKLDDGNHYVEKLSAILKNNNINSITIAYMEVPCCFGMVKIVEEALRRSGKDIPVKSMQVSIEGEIMD
ncbi:MAG: 4Fe-4S binding protein [Thermoanaerobacteraceae bacterium]|nr:4Fe-4S binding protein [Thermoanaerobacteraceae bacterium]